MSHPAGAVAGCNDGEQSGDYFSLPYNGTNYVTNYSDAWRFYVRNDTPDGVTNYLHTYNKDGTTGYQAAFGYDAGRYYGSPSYFSQVQDREVVTNNGTKTHYYFYQRSCKKQ